MLGISDRGSRSGRKKSALHRSVFIVSEKRIISGSMAQAPAGPVPKCIMTAVKNTAAENRIVR